MQECDGTARRTLTATFAAEFNSKSYQKTENSRHIRQTRLALESGRAEKLLHEIMRYKSTIHIALQGQFLNEFRSIKSQIDKIQNKLNSTEKRELCAWYEKTNPWSFQNKANELYEPKTGDWVFKTPEWDGWINGRTQSIWCHGIPGAGKTMLAAHIIEAILRVCEAKDKRTACVFYYCHHGHNQDESLPFLQWLVSQLFRKLDEIPPVAYKAYTENVKPNKSLLLEILDKSLESFDRVYVAVDALDESQSRHNLLALLEVLGTDSRFQKILLFTTSREYSDIELKMCRFSKRISMSNDFVQADIMTYVAAKIKSEPQFGSWPSQLRNEVETTLSNEARGMFRWAVCQLDIIRRFKNEGKIRESLRSLPRTLDETYERLFASIPEEELDFLRHTLHLLCFHTFAWRWNDSMRLSAQVVIDSYVAIDKERSGSSSKGYFYNIDTVKDICGCLILMDKGRNDSVFSVEFSHYTVREFLESDRLPTTSLLKINKTNCYGMFLHSLMSYAIGIEFSEAENAWKSPNSFRGLRSSTRSSTISSLHIYSVATSILALQFHEHLFDPKLVFRFLDPSKSHYLSFRGFLFSFYTKAIRPSCQLHSTDTKMSFWRTSWTTSTKCSCNAAILGNLLMLKCFTLARTFIRTIDLKDVLQEVLSGLVYTSSNGAWNFECKLVELLAEVERLDTDTLRFFEREAPGLVSYRNILPHWIPGHFCVKRNSCTAWCILSKLIELGAKPDPKGFRATPLQIAAYLRDFTGVKTLLESGADPNHTGYKLGIKCEGENPQFHTRLQGFTPLYIVTNVRVRNRAILKSDSRNALSEMHGDGAIGAREARIKHVLLEHGASISSTEGDAEMAGDSIT